MLIVNGLSEMCEWKANQCKLKRRRVQLMEIYAVESKWQRWVL